MTRQHALRVLRQYQAWRRYDGPSVGDLADCGLLSELSKEPTVPVMPDPKTLGTAIDVAIAALATRRPA